jgi:hypothetical protein
MPTGGWSERGRFAHPYALETARPPPAPIRLNKRHRLAGLFFMELNGARSNPRVGVELSRVGALHDELLRRALANPREPRPAPARVRPVLESVTLVLERAGEPMRAREIHMAACELVGEPLLWESVKAALSADVTGEHPRFQRVRYGVYQLARNVRRSTS